MRILISFRSIPQSPNWATGDALAEAFRSLGHDVDIYSRYYSKTPANDPASKEPATLSRLGRPLAAVPFQQPDLHVFMECNDDDPQYLETLDIDCPRIYWGFDDSMHWPFTCSLLNTGRFKLAFFANKALVPRIPGSRYLPYAADVRRFVPGQFDRAGHWYPGSPDQGTCPTRQMCVDSFPGNLTEQERLRLDLSLKSELISAERLDSN
jgi:hypothetical protein